MTSPNTRPAHEILCPLSNDSKAGIHPPVPLSALSARAGFVKKKANEGWQVKKAAGALDVAGFNDDDVITHVRVGEETHNLADLDASGLDSLLVQITASNPESVEFDIKRGTQTHTISFAP